jgi:hypothetical protein
MCLGSLSAERGTLPLIPKPQRPPPVKGKTKQGKEHTRDRDNSTMMLQKYEMRKKFCPFRSTAQKKLRGHMCPGGFICRKGILPFIPEPKKSPLKRGREK